MERERSREKMSKRHNKLGLFDRANLSDESINNETANTKDMKTLSAMQSQRQSSFKYSIREVPELVARLHKSPSASSF